MKLRHLLSIAVLGVGCQGTNPEDDADPGELEDTLIALRSGDVDTRGPGAVPDALRDDATDRVLVKFPGPVTAEQLAALSAAGTVYTYLPSNAFLVRLAPDHRTADGLERLGLAWSGPYHPAYKIAPAIELAVARAVDAQHIVMLQVFPDADLARVRADVAAMGYRIVGAAAGPRFARIRVLASTAELARGRADLARHRDVFWVDLESRRVLLNDTTIWVGQSGLTGGMATPMFARGIQGQGQVVGVIDTGIDPDMCFFRDPARGLPAQNACNGGTTIDALQRKLLAVDFLWSSDCAGGVGPDEWDDHSHGSHVAGTIAGDNFANPLVHDPGDGMAPGAKLVVQDGGFGDDDCADLPGIGCPVVDLNPLFDQAYQQGARLHTNSWGDNENATVQNNYTAASQDVDEFMFAHKDFQIFFAAGNSGPGVGSVGSPSTAKSAISVGATQRATAANSMAFFSSCGPTDDGRIKPDITIPGQGIISASSDFQTGTNNCGTFSSSGTSMASPAAAGLGALVRQYYVDGFYPSGAKLPADGFAPTSALVRATMYSSARQMTNAGAIPGNCQGWGRLSLDDALAFTTDARKLYANDETVGFPTGGAGMQFTYQIQVTASTEPLKVSLAWTDFPSTPAAAIHLVNDLDLTVSGPAGTFLGNVFSGGVSTTGGTADRRNTSEQVLIDNPATGTYTVTVRAQNVPSGPQPFAIVATGVVTPGNQTTTVFADDFESNRGWKMNPDATDTATDGTWVRGNPTSTSSNGPKQLGTTTSGLNDLVTGRTLGTSAGDNDVDGGTTTVRSPAIAVPATGTVTLSFNWYFAHAANSSTADSFRVEVIGSPNATVVEEIGSAADDDAAWLPATFDLSPWHGQTVRLRVTAVDAGGASLVEAAVDDVLVVQQPQ